VYVVAGPSSWTAARLVNAVLSTVGVALIGLVTAQLLGYRAGLAALALAAVHPTLIALGASMQLEPLLMVLVLGTLACALQHRRQPTGWRWAIASGVLAGLGVLTRETAALMIPVAAYLVWTARPKDAPERAPFSGAAMTRPLLLVVIAVAIVLPWTARNATRLDAFVPVSTSSGLGLAGMYNSTSMRSSDPPAVWIEPWRDERVLQVMDAHEGGSEAEVDEALRSESFRFMRDHPGYVLKASIYNTQRFLSLDGGAYDRETIQYLPLSRTLVGIGLVMSYAIYALAFASLIWRRSELARVPPVVWVFPVTVILFAAVFLPGQLRYRMLVEPFLIMMAAPALVAIVDRVRSGSPQPS
jgi:4-amino-4-deoxy-L-arabinose transferase-like glycosyltransferase